MQYKLNVFRNLSKTYVKCTYIHVLSYILQYYIFSTGVAYVVVTVALTQISM